MSRHDQVRQAVQERYASAARSSLALAESDCCGRSCCGDETATHVGEERGCCASSCCGGTDDGADPITSGLYDEGDTPFAAALEASLGCGNPTALAKLQPGEDVLDLGSGGGLDVLLSARRVGPAGTAYGLDMTPEMLELAERNRAEAGVTNARFLRGTIEDIPLPDASVDVIVSNCVINLSPDKDAVIGESFRVLRPGGRFAVSDIVLLRDIPDALRSVMGLWTGCITGSLRDVDFIDKLHTAGFVDASIEVTRRYDRADLESLATQLDSDQLPDGMTVEAAVEALDGAIASAFIRATKP